MDITTATDSSESLSPEGIQLLSWLTSLSQLTGNSLLDASVNLDIGSAIRLHLPWFDDPDLSRARLRFLELLARLALQLFQDTSEQAFLTCCRESLDKCIRRQATEGGSVGEKEEDHRIAAVKQLYGQALYQSFLRGTEPDDDVLDEAVRMAEESVLLSRELEEDLVVKRKLDLWTCLCQKARAPRDADEEREFLRRSVELAEEVYEWVRNGEEGERKGALWAGALNNLAISYRVRWASETGGQYGDLVRAIELGAELCRGLAAPEWEDQADARVQALANQSFQLLRAYGQWVETGELSKRLPYQDGEGLLARAVSHLQESIAIPCERTRSHLENGLTFVIEIGRIPKAVQADVLGRVPGILTTALERMREVVLYENREDLLECVGTFFGLSRYAAAASLQAGAEPYEALKILEEGRGVAISIQLDSRAGGQGSPSTDEPVPDQDVPTSLRAKYFEARKRLLGCVEEEAPFHERHRLVKQVLDLQRQINAQEPGCLETIPPVDTLAEMAKDTTIVVINITPIRSDAFIISRLGISVQPLPGLDEGDLSDRAIHIQKGLNHLADPNTSSDTFAKMISALKVLWAKLVLPVLKAIGKSRPHRASDSEAWPRVCWVPTGVLGMYPIHAAGPYRRMGPQDAGAISRVVSSYAPSLRILSLHMTSTEISALSRSVAAAVIAESQPPKGEDIDFHPLQHAERGIEIVRRTFPPHGGPSGGGNDLMPRNPDKATALRLLGSGISLVQFFCHGLVDYKEPLNSKLFLHDWQTDPLTAGSIMNLNIRNPKPKLAFLSACWGAHGGVENLQDEISHVACALQVAGFPCVVGSLWEAVETDMIVLLDVFYGTLSRVSGSDRISLSPSAIAEALHVAVMRVRECSLEENPLSNPLRWAPFMCYGN